MCLHKLSLVDDIMEAIGSPKKYQRLSKWINRIIIGYIVYMFYEFAACVYCQFMFYPKHDINTYDLNNINIVLLCIMFLSFYPDFVHISSALIWGTILGLVFVNIYFVNSILFVCVKMTTYVKNFLNYLSTIILYKILTILALKL